MATENPEFSRSATDQRENHDNTGEHKKEKFDLSGVKINTPPQINVSSAKPSDPDGRYNNKVTPLTSDEIGHSLSKTIIYIIAAVFASGIIGIKFIDDNHEKVINESISIINNNQKNKNQDAATAENIRILSEIVSKSEANTTSQRESILKIVELVLVNVLLPIFTAIIGYTLGKNKENKENNQRFIN